MNNLDIKYNFKDGAKWDLPVYLNRQNPIPLDGTSVYKTLEEAQTYATSDPKAYPGQIISVVTESEVKVYKINNGQLEELGKGSLVTNQNPKLLATADNIGQIIYLTAQVIDGEDTYSPGPYIVSGDGTVSKIGTTTVSGDIAGVVATLQGTVSTLEGTVGKKVDKTDITQSTGTSTTAVMSQKAVSDVISVEETRAKEAEENLDNKVTDLEAMMIYDVSANNRGEVFESISTLLNSSDLDTLIPISVRHGGMMIRFIQGSVPSSDNKYMQYRLMVQDFSTDGGDWVNSPSKVPEEEAIQSTEQAIEFQTNSGVVVGKITETESDFNNLKTGGKSVATQEALLAGLAAKQDTLTAGDGITIENNVISADDTKEIVEVESTDEEQRWEDDTDDTDVYAKVNKSGIFAKKYHDINGVELQFVDQVEELKKEVCNINYNTVSLSPFIKKYINKECDEWNQLTIAMCGDSIFGIQKNPGMALTPDCNDETEEDAGYITGHFPPNMWVQGVGYKLLKALQYDSADVKYYNHVASEVTKTGTWTDLFSQSNNLDQVRVVKSETSGDTISLSFTDAYYAKLNVCDYLLATEDATIKVTISENGGEYVTPASLGIIESHSFAEGHSGEYSLTEVNGIKFSQFVFKGFDTNKNYVLKVEHTNTNNLVVWGFETWTRERLNVIVTAEGANTASNQYNNPQRFYNENTNADLCIIDAPFLNDFSVVGWQTWYKGKINLSSSTPSSPSQYNFYYCEESGVYTNFGSVKASVGDYIEWSGSQWVLGSTKLNTLFSAYNEKLPAMLDMCKKIGIPMLIIVTHPSDIFIGKPFIDTAVKLMRLHIENYQFPCIDVYKYRDDLNLTDIWTDGTHLNDTGIAMYMDLISKVLNKDCKIAYACESWKCGDFYGHSDGGSVIFRYVGYPAFTYLKLKNLPKVYILNNPNVTVTNITKQGFMVSGSGEYDYHVIVNN